MDNAVLGSLRTIKHLNNIQEEIKENIKFIRKETAKIKAKNNNEVL